MEFFKYSDVLSIKQKNHVIACYFKKYEEKHRYIKNMAEYN